MLLFFFSSRRRHTRWTGDWSSDVCSSDVHGDRPQASIGAGHLGLEAQRYAFVGLDAHHQDVSIDAVGAQRIEHQIGRRLEANRHFANAPRQALTRAKIKRHAGPAPVFDFETDGGKGLPRRGWGDARLLAIADHRLAGDEAGTVLAAHRIPRPEGGVLADRERLDGIDDLDLFIAHRLGREAHRRFHGHDREYLHQVILDHVAQGPGFFVIAAALLDADAFRDRNLNVIHVAAVPDRLEDAVGEAKDQDVANRLFAQVMVNAIDLLLVEDLMQLLIELAGTGEIAAKGLFDDDARPGRGAGIRGGHWAVEAGSPQLLDDHRKKAGRG